MDYGQAEQEIVDRINSKLVMDGIDNLYEAALFPETTAEAKSFYGNFTKTRAAVQFIDSSPQPNNSAGFVSQEEIVKFRLSFEARKLRGAGNLYPFMALVKKYIIGWKLSGAMSRLTLSKYDILEFEQGAWQPYFEFECRLVNVQDLIDNPDDVPFGNVTFGDSKTTITDANEV